MRKADGTPLGVETESVLPIVGGGFDTGGSINDAGTVATASSDGCGGYRRKKSEAAWQRANTFRTFPAWPPAVTQFAGAQSGSYAENPLGSGVYAIAIAPSSDTRGYMAWCGNLFRTDDAFDHVALIPGPGIPCYPNGGNQRLYNHKLAIDPINPDAFIVGSEGKGAYYSLDGGATAPVKVAGPPDVTAKQENIHLPVLVAIDRRSATLNGRKSRAAQLVPESGVWITTAGLDGQWANSGGPQRGSHMIFDDHTDDLYVCDSAGAAMWRYRAGAWAQVTIPGGFKPQCLVIDPFDPNFKFAVSQGNSMISTAADGTFQQGEFFGEYPYVFNYDGADAPWQTQIGDMSKPSNSRGGCVLFPSLVLPNRAVQGEYLMWHGTGTCEFTVPDKTAFAFGGPVTFTDTSAGQEMLVTNMGLWRPGRPPITGSWDKGFWLHKDLGQAPAYHLGTHGIAHGWAIDYAAADVDFIAGIANYNEQKAGYASDGGISAASWNVFVNQHPDGYSLGGDMGVASKNDIVWFPANNGRPVRSGDRGATPWSYIQFEPVGGVSMPTSGAQGWNESAFFHKRNVLASKNQPGRIFAYNFGPDAAPTLRGLWEAGSGSAGGFKQVKRDILTNQQGSEFRFYMRLRETPGHAGELWMSSEGENDRFARSVDWGRTWSEVSTSYNGSTKAVTAVLDFNFGAPKPGGSGYPSIRFAGNVGGEYGIWQSDDNMATVTKRSVHPMGITDRLNCIIGSPNLYDLWIYGIGSTSFTKSAHVQELAAS